MHICINIKKFLFFKKEYAAFIFSKDLLLYLTEREPLAKSSVGQKKSDFYKTPSKLYHKKIIAYPKNFINNNNFNFLGYKNRQKSWHSCAIIEVRENLSKREQCRAHAALKLCLNLKTKIGGFVHIAQKLFTNYRGFAKNY